jgi:hypothetical protein
VIGAEVEVNGDGKLYCGVGNMGGKIGGKEYE